MSVEYAWFWNPSEFGSPILYFWRKDKKNKENLRSPLVAGEGIEPPAFGLWAQRATTAPPRDAVFKTDAKI